MNTKLKCVTAVAFLLLFVVGIYYVSDAKGLMKNTTPTNKAEQQKLPKRATMSVENNSDTDAVWTITMDGVGGGITTIARNLPLRGRSPKVTFPTIFMEDQAFFTIIMNRTSVRVSYKELMSWVGTSHTFPGPSPSETITIDVELTYKIGPTGMPEGEPIFGVKQP
jgi:hypothetical protein